MQVFNFRSQFNAALIQAGISINSFIDWMSSITEFINEIKAGFAAIEWAEIQFD